MQVWTRLALDSFKGPPTQDGEGHGPPASRSTVGCKPGHDSPWDTITETSVKGSDAIKPQGWEKGSPSETPRFFVAPLFGRYSSSPGYSTVSKAYAGARGACAGRAQAYGVRIAVGGFDSHDFFEGGFFVGLVEVFAFVEEQVKVFSFLDSDERKVFRKASCCLVSSGML